MSQIEIAQIIEQIKQEITVDSNGHGKASIRATARLADVQDSSLRRALSSAALEPSVLAKSLIEQGFTPAALETWNQGIPDMGVAAVIEYYAFDAGRYCKQQARLVCKAFNRIGVRAWMQDITGWAKPATQQPEQPPKSIAASHEAAQLALLVGEFAGLEKSLTAQLAVNAATKVNPALKPAADELKTAIASTNPAEDAFLNATQIGEVVGMSARAVNNWLVQHRLQYRTEDKKIPYRPTESGKQWGRMVPALARSSNQTVFQLRWLPEIVQVISE
ncbi:phage antirepressor KilAC domain-containing protein [Nostoc punctiforme]|uniref:phage antirepressor KilAC domain-containing protein n=1 Tax=Nostoc punctiforme TaxID=272131 RepID=UPI001F54B52C|nr:phage antirepressor KilAC domain-containing protein [Nostoc punctiforme]